MLEAALSLSRRGFLVFPIKAGEKKPPLVANWPAAATSDEAQIRSWWTQWPQANVGIHCDGLLVIDVDPAKGGFESLAALEKEILLEETYETETPRGGRHIYYRLAPGAAIRNGVDVLGDGIDVRTTAGYVLGAGSTAAGRDYLRVVDAPIAVADGALVERLRARDEPSGDARRQDGRHELLPTDAEAAVARAKDFLRLHPVAVEGHGGDHHTFRTVCRIRDFGVPEERAAEALEEWNARCEPPWEPGELALKIANAYQYAQDAAGKLTPEALGFEVVSNSVAQVATGAGKETNIPVSPASTELLHPADVGLDEILGAEYLIKGVLEKQSNAVAFGHWNVGKTFVVLDMAASVATGTPWFEKRVRQARVLYIGYEGIRAMKKRMLALRGKYPTLNDRSVPFAWHPMRHPLTQGAGVTELGEILAAFEKRHGGPPDLLIIDPLANALGGDDADANLMGALNTCVAEIMRKQHCTVLRVHHSGHGNQDRARGHSSLPAGVDTEIRIDEQEIALTKQRDDVRGKVSFKLEIVKLGKDRDGDDVTTCVVTYVEDNALSPDLSRPQQEMLDALLKLRGDGGTATKGDMRECAPGKTVEERKKLIDVLERKQYLRVEGAAWVIAERGPMQIFD